MPLIWDSTVLGTTHETFMTTREEALEDLSMFGIKAPQIYLIDIIPLVEPMEFGRMIQGLRRE
ncbi:MAG: hypothetical protein ABSB22_06070 [Thermodesulfobacteriota bacterium]|jgi:hypothetical protein